MVTRLITAMHAGWAKTFLGERYRYIARRCGRNGAVVAVGRSILVIIWAPLCDDRGPPRRPRPGLLRLPPQPGRQGPTPLPRAARTRLGRGPSAAV
jgi:hypothetical protein